MNVAPWIGFDLCTMHHPARRRIEPVPPMHRAPVVPEDEIAGSPVMPPRERVLRRFAPDFVEQRVRLLEGASFYIGVAPPAEVEATAAGLGMYGHERVQRPR